jgi:glycogen operon protein
MITTCVSDWISAEGAPLPLGVTWIPEGECYNFSLYSKYADDVSLLFYQEADLVNPVLIRKFDYLRNKTARVWHCIVPAAAL